MNTKQIVQIVVIVGCAVGAGALLLKPTEDPAQSEAEQVRHFICEDEARQSGFDRTIGEIASFAKERKFNTCSVCDSRFITEAAVCDSCSGYTALGPNSIIPEQCSHCNATMRK